MQKVHSKRVSTVPACGQDFMSAGAVVGGILCQRERSRLFLSPAPLFTHCVILSCNSHPLHHTAEMTIVISVVCKIKNIKLHVYVNPSLMISISVLNEWFKNA
jgi:hypothetical protein